MGTAWSAQAGCSDCAPRAEVAKTRGGISENLAKRAFLSHSTNFRTHTKNLSSAVWSPPRVLSWVLGDLSLYKGELTLAKKSRYRLCTLLPGGSTHVHATCMRSGLKRARTPSSTFTQSPRPRSPLSSKEARRGPPRVKTRISLTTSSSLTLAGLSSCTGRTFLPAGRPPQRTRRATRCRTIAPQSRSTARIQCLASPAAPPRC